MPSNFSKFIEAYKKQGIPIFAVMPQNEFNSAQIFPSCCWTSASLANFIGNYLGPAMQVQGVEIMFGTMERANESLVDTVLTDPVSGKYVKRCRFPMGGEGSYHRNPQTLSRVEALPNRARMWRWQERLEGCHVFLGVDATFSG